MRYTAFTLTVKEANSLSNYVEAGLDARLNVIQEGKPRIKKALEAELKRAFKVTLMTAALHAFEQDGLVIYKEDTEEDDNGNSVPTVYFWMNEKPIARKVGADHKGQLIAGLTTKDVYIDRIMEETMTIGKSHAEYVSEILYVAYLQTKASIYEQEDKFWTNRRTAWALEVLEDVYGFYMIDPVAHAEVA